MNDVALVVLVAGALLIATALSSTVLARLPLSAGILYLATGAAIGPWGLGLVDLHVERHTELLERLAEGVVAVSLFTCGLKLSPRMRDRAWLLPLRLAVFSMVLTAGLIAALAWLLLDLPFGACVLLGGILAPTDPVLASDVQVTHHTDRDRLRFALTGEGGLNDGTAFPIVLLGLGLLGAHDLGARGSHWLLVETLWASFGGLAIGALLGLAVARLVLYLRREHKEAVGLDDFLALGLVGLAYGAAHVAEANAFLAVFAAGVAVRQFEQAETSSAENRHAGERAAELPDEADAIAVDPKKAPAYMAQAVLGFNEQVERIGELTVVVTIGVLLASVDWSLASWGLVALILLAVRPLSVAAGLAGSSSSRDQRWLTAWFGIRGIGSLYYLAYAMNHGLGRELWAPVAALTLSAVVVSILVHGISVTPLMGAYERVQRTHSRRGDRADPSHRKENA